MNFALIALGGAQLLTLENSPSVLICGTLSLMGAICLLTLLSREWFKDWRRSDLMVEQPSDPSPPDPRTRLGYRIGAGLMAIGSAGMGLIVLDLPFQFWSEIGEDVWFGTLIVSLPLGCFGFGALLGYYALSAKEIRCNCLAESGPSDY